MPARRIQLGRLLRGTIAAVVLALAAPMTAGAHDTLANVDTDNVYRGYVGKQGNRVVPWVRTFYLQSFNCARFQMESQYTDLEMVVIGTNPSRRYRNDNGALPNPCGATCPIVRIAETPGFAGYFTVHVSPKDGAAVEGEFLLRLTVKPFMDPICSPETPVF
jgi:hypothetical protein